MWKITIITIIPAIHSRYSKQGSLLGDQVQAETGALMKYEMLPLGTSSNLIMHLVEIVHLVCLRLETAAFMELSNYLFHSLKSSSIQNTMYELVIYSPKHK